MEMVFKYQIGDVLQHKTVAWEPKLEERYKGIYPDRIATPLIVLGRIWEECPGGVQKHYRLRGNDLKIFFQLHEEEVEPYVAA